MSKLLQALIQELAIARDERELRLRYMDKAGEVFGAQHWGIYLHNERSELAEIDMKGLPDHFIDYYQEAGIEVDPVMQFVMETHTPAHEQLVLTEEEWKQSVLYREGCGKKYDHEHIMAGPIVAQGRVIGTLHFARKSGTPSFKLNEVSGLGALCAHISVYLATLRSQPRQFISPEVKRLTQRELQIAELVAKGLTNAEIGSQLWITQNSVKQALKRMFRKLNVSARAELVARLRETTAICQINRTYAED